MRIGIFSDVHGNLEALRAVQVAYEDEQIDLLLCAGDLVGYGASPNECVETVRAMTPHVVLGNHDAAVSGCMDYSFYYEAARRVLDLHAESLEKDNMEWLRSLPYSRRFNDLGIKLCHGSPISEQEFEYIFAPEQAWALLPHFDELDPITFIGHSHLCRVFALTPHAVEEVVQKQFTFDERRKYIVSVGSVGQPRDYDNRASYTVFETESRRFWFKRVEYDIETAANKIFASRLERNFGNRLFIGV
ncbi:MAG: metallophosphoesterase family protein [Polyangia bacterium]